LRESPKARRASTAPIKDSGSVILESRSVNETEALGFSLAAMLPRGSFVGLYGELAAGKTCFVRGMARFFAQDERVSSPSFTLVNEYGSEPTLYHVDLYRLHGPEDVLGLGYEELFDSTRDVCVVEWADRAVGLLPDERVDVRFEHVDRETRRLTVTNLGAFAGPWQKQLTQGPSGKASDTPSS
jgi:tRNA threonylcarbamoyladenosine biosynthesis protein TsaE